jgi:hypothetical protein
VGIWSFLYSIRLLPRHRLQALPHDCEVIEFEDDASLDKVVSIERTMMDMRLDNA